MQAIRVGLIGTGVMGLDHAALLAAGTGGGMLAALYDADPDRAAAAAVRFDCRRADTPADLISAVDAVLVASPDPTHAALALACVEAGRPVLIEKPLAATLDDCRAVVEREVAAGRRLVQVGFMRRFDPGYRAMRAARADGRYGPALFLHCQHRNAIGPDYLTSRLVIANSAVHEIDIARFVLGEEIAAATVISPRASGLAPGRQPQFIVLESAGGVVVDIEAFVDAQYGYEVRAELVCEAGTVSLAPNPPIAVREARRDGFLVEQDWRGRFRDAYRQQMTEWLHAVRNGQPTDGSSAWDGYMASIVADTCLSALQARQRQPVTLPDTPALYR